MANSIPGYRNRGLLLACVGLVSALLAAACGGADPTATSVPRPTATAVPAATVPASTAAPTAAATAPPTAAPSPTPRPTNTPPPVPTPTAAPVSQGQIRVAVAVLRHGMLPSDLDHHKFLEPLYDYVAGVKMNGELDPESGFASTWTTSPDAKKWTFGFRRNVQFSNGETATSQDVKFGFEWAIQGETGSTNKNALTPLVASMQTPDDATLIMNLNQPSLFLPIQYMSAPGSPQMGQLLPKNHITSKGREAAGRAPVGSGPFTLKENAVGSRITFEARPSHWYWRVPRYKTLEFMSVPDEATRVALLKTGDALVAEIGRSPVPSLKQSGFVVVVKEGASIMNLRPLNQYVAGNPLGNLKVRQAMDLAIDRNTIVETFMKGQAVATINFSPPSWDSGFEMLPVPKQDLEAAKKMLQESGHAGFALDVVIHEWQGLPEGPEIMEAIAVWWEKIGVKVTRLPLAYATVLERWTTGKFTNPTVTGAAALVNRPAFPSIGNTFNPASPFRLGEDARLLQISQARDRAPTLEEYNRLGREFGRGSAERVTQFVIAEFGELYGVKPGLGGEKWSLGRGSQSMNILPIATGKFPPK